MDFAEPPRYASRRSHGTSPWIPVLLIIGVVGVASFLIYESVSRKKEGNTLFKKEEEGPRECDETDVLEIITYSVNFEKNYRTAIRNMWRADMSTTMGKKTEIDMKAGMLKIRESLRSNIMQSCEVVDSGVVTSTIDRVTTQWEQNERAALGRPPTQGGVEKGGKQARELTAIEKEDRRLDRLAKTEIDEVLSGLTPPESYADRAAYLIGEFVDVRDESASEGINNNGFALKVARCERTFFWFEQWAKPKERNRKSFKWAKSAIGEMTDLRDQWRSWSSGKIKLEKSDIETSLREIVRTLKKADVIFEQD